MFLGDLCKEYVGPHDNYSQSEVGVFECMAHPKNLK